MRRTLRKLPLLAAALLAALALGACGDSHTKVTTGTYAGESGANAPYLNLGPLIYQVQLSRQLNPANSEDAGYLQGVPYAEGRLAAGRGVVRGVPAGLQQHRSGPQSGRNDHDQRHRRQRLPPGHVLPTNHYVYRAVNVPRKGLLPNADTTASFGPTQGALLLFKIKTYSLDNRPLEIRIANPEAPAQTVSAELDV